MLRTLHSSKEKLTGYLKCLCCFLVVDAAPVSSQAVDVSTSSCPVFLSYQWDLQHTVKGLKSRIEENGIQCWMDIGQMGGGDALFSKIDAGVRACKVTQLLFLKLFSFCFQMSRCVTIKLLITGLVVYSIVELNMQIRRPL